MKENKKIPITQIRSHQLPAIICIKFIQASSYMYN